MLVKGERSFIADTGLRPAMRFGGTAEFWMKLQMTHDLEEARRRLDTAPVRNIIIAFFAFDKRPHILNRLQQL